MIQFACASAPELELAIEALVQQHMHATTCIIMLFESLSGLLQQSEFTSSAAWCSRSSRKSHTLEVGSSNLSAVNCKVRQVQSLSIANMIANLKCAIATFSFSLCSWLQISLYVTQCQQFVLMFDLQLIIIMSLKIDMYSGLKRAVCE